MSRIQIPIDKGWTPDAVAHEMPPGGLVTCKNVYRHNGLWVQYLLTGEAPVIISWIDAGAPEKN